MNLDLPESASILRDEARNFFAAECPPSLVKTMAGDAKGHPPRLWQQMVEMGWPGIIVPEQDGGSGDSFLALLVLMQEMGRAAAPVPFFSTAVVGGLALLEGASEAQKAAMLPRLCRGDLLLSLALSEPGADFGLDHLATTAAAEGRDYLISGTKLFVTDAHVATFLICVTDAPDLRNTDPAAVRAFLIEPGRPGVSMAQLDTRLRDQQFEVTFSNVQASAQDAIGGLPSARAWLERVLEQAMVAKCAEMIGAGRKLLEMTVEHAKNRQQFGKPIGTLQAVQHHCANLATCIETAELMTYRAGWMIDQGLPYRKEALKAKAWTNEACKQAAALGHQVHGGIGFMREYDLYLYSTRMTNFAQSFGGTSWCHDRLATELFGAERRHRHEMGAR